MFPPAKITEFCGKLQKVAVGFVAFSSELLQVSLSTSAENNQDCIHIYTDYSGLQQFLFKIQHYSTPCTGTWVDTMATATGADP
jgi:hypothetical protein